MMGSVVTLEAMESGVDGVAPHKTTGEMKQRFQARERPSQTWKEGFILLARKVQEHLGGVQDFQLFLGPPRISLFQISRSHSFPIKSLFHVRNVASL